MQDQLQKAFNLIKKTGDKLVVFDGAKSDSAYVVLTLKDYENLVLGKSEVRGLTEDELLDKINRDIAIWKSEQNMEEELESGPDYFEELPSNGAREESREKISKKAGKSWSIPTRRKMNAEEIIEEDRQYLIDNEFDANL